MGQLNDEHGPTPRTKDPKQVNLLKICAALVVFGIVVPLVTHVIADDSTARFGAGGIEFLKSEDIRMLEEVLEISTEIVRVKFRFLNESDRDILTTVAFPLPPYPPFFTDGRSGVSSPATLMETFKVYVNGQPVPTQLERKAFVHGIDITTQLRALGLSDDQIFWDADLKEGQEAVAAVLDGGKDPKSLSYRIDWKVAETRFWQQDFPAGKEVVVEHTYKPAVGSAYGVVHERGAHGDSDIPTAGTETHKDVCLDDNTRRAIENQIKACVAKNPGWVTVSFDIVEYILGTGRNWKGPIGEFTLRIKKQSPDRIVSLCFPGKPKRASPTLLEFHHKDFMPPERLVVYFYTVCEH